jgi:hypothetical protein
MPSDHPLLVKALKVSDHLGDYPDQLTRDVSDILLAELPLLLAPAARSAERRLELRHSIWRSEILQRVTLPELTEALAETALHGRIL